MAAGRDHALAAREQLAHELEADAAVRAGDEGMRHAHLLRRGEPCRWPAV
jgi:hypothetical protein